ncbi:MAG TPA: ATP synthase F1 subunit gamma [Candidatus Acidoferrum sp.]|jgi:F-type H+-transporting ATPase subunit gamma|nr:ATP synthase F1 subunit gamma [Candidatus Acidoferrum sp.]
MPTLLDFRRRIRSVKNTQQITRAMKFVAAARLRRAQEAALAARPYAQELARVLRSTMARLESPQHPLLARRPEERILVIVLSGERGLAGAYNANILKRAAEFLRSKQGKKIVVIPIGKKGRDALRKAGMEFAGEYVNVLARVDLGIAREIANLVTELYSREAIDAVYTVFSEFKNVLAPVLVTEKLLPIEKIEESEETAGERAASQIDYLYEQPETQILDRLLPRYVETQILRIMLESSAAEHAARMTAMEAATKNAGEVIDALTLHMNKVRQAAITKEIIEIVSGAAGTA